MKPFLRKLALFLLPLVVVFLFIEFKLRHRNSYYEQKYKGLMAQKDSIQILVLGNSHAEAGVSTTELSLPAYNLAFGYQPLRHDELLTRKFLPYLKQLKYVLISIDYHSFYFDNAGERDFFYAYYYGIRDFDDFKKRLSFFFFVYGPKTSVGLLTSKNATLTKGVAGGDPSEYDSANVNDAKGEDRARVFITMAKTDNDLKKKVFRDLDKFIYDLQKRGVTPVIISAPCSGHLNKFLDPGIMKDNLLMVDSLRNKYKLVYLNYLSDARFTDQYFVDVDHLNSKGALLFTGILNDTIIQLESGAKGRLSSNQKLKR